MERFLAWSLLLAYSVYQEAKRRDFSYLPVGAGAVAAMVASAFDQPDRIQLLVLVFTVIVFMAVFRNARLRALSVRPPVGAVVTVRNPVSAERGAVEWNGRLYPARTVQETEHPVGKKLVVARLDPDFLYVVGEKDPSVPSNAGVSDESKSVSTE